MIDVVNLLAAFVCFGFMASGTYLLNDLFDIQDDRKHSTKRLRQIASGQLSVPTAIAAFLVLTLGSLAGGFTISVGFGIMLLIYAFVTVAYSFRLKRLPIIDVFILAGLFTIRVWAGGIVVGAYTSVWFTMFIGLVFLSLALTKRYVEIQKSSSASISGRGYRTGDAAFVLAFGAATGTAAVLALSIYGLLAPNRLLGNAALILIMAAILAAWFMRIWLIAVRGELHDDPVLFAIKDKVSLASLGVIALCFLIESAKPIWTNWF
jgi:4-hydroxybenzoate polyprenyltransferase